uniref:Large ribosomal subunit protein uL13c n=1 Tax=Gracilaria vermiculophylla TaxID=2608709 RepID=A0A345U952_9FLOR|nr:ribosomal protein L13 [Gracilaria vermiculophylla]AXI96988.1 ribosomal protein L13 [Gracilaria vermiculophylla]QXU75192.1 ribosomal protein L13 [Gracilaria vermiculophylla]WDZ67992.1 ribosomal protein L13 [Gracilaria vermiculophylla]
MNKTYIAPTNNYSKWYIINAKDQNLGRLSSKIAKLLRGKNSTSFTPYINSKIYIVLINSQLINVTGKKLLQKTYTRHSGYPGGLKIKTFNDVLNQKPNMILEKSIKGMLPKGILGRQLFKQLKIYPDITHPHKSQKPETIKLI